MAKIYKNITELVGNTPLVELSGIARAEGLSARIFAKCEYFNPTGSVKDRAAKRMIECAEAAGTLKPGATIIEPTSGNTGIGIASAAAVKGYRAVLVMPETMSVERRNILKAYGAEIELTPGAKGMAGTLERAEQLKNEIPNAVILAQFDNPANAAAHFDSTGPEIWSDTDGNIDILVATVGTGGTITGTAKYLKSKNPEIKVVAVEPASSPLLSKGVAGAHKIQGIGANFVPAILDRTLCDEIIAVENDEAFERGRQTARIEGFTAGISSGAALAAAIQLAKRPENTNKNIVVIFPDGGDRYFSTPLFG